MFVCVSTNRVDAVDWPLIDTAISGQPESTLSAALHVPLNYTEPALHFDGGCHRPTDKCLRVVMTIFSSKLEGINTSSTVM